MLTPCLSPGFLYSLPPPLGPLPSKDKHCFSAKALDSWNKLCLAALLDTSVSNPMEYDFSFQLEIRGPCLLAGERGLHRLSWGGGWCVKGSQSVRGLGGGFQAYNS